MRLPFDPQMAVVTLSKADKRLAKLIERAGPFTLRPQAIQSPLEALARAIVYQQLSGKAAATIYSRVRALYPSSDGLDAQAILDTPDETLRTAGMSWAKIASLKDLASKTLDGTVPTLARLKRMPDEEILSRLVQIRGIGPWSVEMLLMFRLGRPDVLPVSDLGVRKGFMLAYGRKEMPTPGDVLKHGERWRPYRSVASWYMWRAVDLHVATNPPVVL
jgi:3-methyladenine DNA glycosylase/8-oxoguanine DNA glycosylase